VSKENVVLFIKAANKKPELNTRLVTSQKIGEWVDVARDAGFDFTADDFAGVLERTIQKKITKDNAVPEFLLVREAIGAGELSRRLLYSFIGGVARTCDFQSLSRQGQGASIAAYDFGIGRK
jgi:hypothetical protein